MIITISALACAGGPTASANLSLTLERLSLQQNIHLSAVAKLTKAAKSSCYGYLGPVSLG